MLVLKNKICTKFVLKTNFQNRVLKSHLKVKECLKKS